jgi:RNA polymerase sigma-70 factor (ECF subfamily)
MSVLSPARGTPAVGWSPPPEGAEPVDRVVPSAVPRQEPDAGRSGALSPTGDQRSMPTPATGLPDVELVELARHGDRPAFDELIRRHDERMRGLAYRLLADRHGMDDALQEAYLKAYRALPRFRAGSDFGTWLYRITYNACIDDLRRRKRLPVSTEDPVDPVSSRPGPDRVVSASETVRAALAELPVDQRITVVLVDGEGFDHREAAEILGVAPGTVASRLHRARAALRRILGEEAR